MAFDPLSRIAEIKRLTGNENIVLTQGDTPTGNGRYSLNELKKELGNKSLLGSVTPLTQNIEQGVYIASEIGVYPNFGNINVSQEDFDNGLVLLTKNNDGTFTKDIFPIPGVILQSQINVENGVTGFEPIGNVDLLDKKAVSGSEVFKSIEPLRKDIDLLMNGIEKYTVFNGVDSEVILDEYTLAVNGDFIEWESKPYEEWTPSLLYGLFGTRAVNQRNVIGYYAGATTITEIGIRENLTGTAPWIRFNNLGELKDSFNTFKLLVNNGNWELYVNGILKGTQPKTSSVLINNIGYAYASNYSKFLLKKLNINTQTKSLITDTVGYLGGAINAEVVYEKKETILSDFYVSFEKNGTDVAGNSLFGKYIVYCKRIGYENSYTGIEIWHEKDLSDEVYKDYWRIGFAEEYTFLNGVMTRTFQKVLAAGESECVWKRQNIPNQKADFTGGFHGDEIMRENGFKLLINGAIDDMSVEYLLKPAGSVEYSIISDMTEVADSIDGVITPITGHPIDCSHYKRTTFKIGGYETYNKLVWSRSVPVMLWYFGICCYGKVQAIQGFNDSQEFSEFDLKDNSLKLTKKDGNRIDFQNPITKLNGYVESELIKPKDKENLTTLRIQDRFYDSKYYNMYQENITTSKDDIWESIMNVVFN